MMSDLISIDGASPEACADACLSFRHDFGLLDDEERAKVMFQAMEWLRAWQKALTPQAQPAPPAVKVKPLVWTEDCATDPSVSGVRVYVAGSSYGRYEIHERLSAWNKFFPPNCSFRLFSPTQNGCCAFPDLEAAKVYAQQLHENAIRRELEGYSK